VIYLDSSLLTAIFFREANAGALVGWMESVREQKLMISAWTLTEMASVGGIKRRTGAVDVATGEQALVNFQRFASGKLGLVEIEPGDFRTAAVLIATPAALRAGDALHLAVARRLNARLASIDRRLCEAADLLGIGRVDVA
jgi:predicted nucleic acid-binding protein